MPETEIQSKIVYSILDIRFVESQKPCSFTRMELFDKQNKLTVNWKAFLVMQKHLSRIQKIFASIQKILSGAGMSLLCGGSNLLCNGKNYLSSGTTLLHGVSILLYNDEYHLYSTMNQLHVERCNRGVIDNLYYRLFSRQII